MKITKAYLKKLIKEEIAVMEGDDYDDEMEGDDDANDNKQKGEVGGEEVGVGNFLEIRISNDGRSKMIEKLEDKVEYKNTRGYMNSFKALVQIVEIAELSEDY